MTKGELETNFKHIASSITDIKKIVDRIETRQASHYKSIIHLNKDVEFLKKDMESHRKNVRWGIGLVVPVITSIIYFTTNYFTQK